MYFVQLDLYLEMIEILILLYFLIGFSASVIGAMAGLGGGVIIKPVLDFFGHYDLSTIGVLSAATVLTMSTVSLLQVKSMHGKLDKSHSLLIAIGSILGGFFGKGIYNYSLTLGSTTITGVIQSSLLALILVLIFLYMKYKKYMTAYTVENKSLILTVGVILGMLSAFLGIGGGPLNVAVLYFLFSMNAKNAVINSTFIIFFSQLSALILIACTTGFAIYDLSMLGYMMFGGVLGGLVGSKLIQKINNDRIEFIFNVTILLIILVNVFNVVNMLS